MSLYNYKKFLDKYDSDKIVKKYFALKQEAKKRKNLRKIGLDEYFQPVTSVIKKELEPFHNLNKKRKNKKNKEDTLGEDDEDILGENDEDESEEKKYKKTKNFLSFQDLNKVYSKKERETQEYLRYWKNVAKNIYDIDFDNLPSNFDNLTDEKLKIKQNNLNYIGKSSNVQEKYNPDIKLIDNITDDLLREIQAIKISREKIEEEKEFEK